MGHCEIGLQKMIKFMMNVVANVHYLLDYYVCQIQSLVGR